MKPHQFLLFQKLIDEISPTLVGEIGVHNGRTSAQICDYILSKSSDKLIFKGYDAFEMLDPHEGFEVERNGKGTSTEFLAFKKLTKISRKYPDRLDFELIKGFTKDTLTEPVYFDFVYIDAGHDYYSVKHDWEMVNTSKLIIFDDYMMGGVNRVINEIVKLDHEVEFTLNTEESRGVAIVRNY